MAYEQKEGQGALFKNEKQNDRQPDYKGTIAIGGTTYEIAAWEKISKSGMSYMSLQASIPRERSSQPAQASALVVENYPDFAPSEDMSDDLPL